MVEEKVTVVKMCIAKLAKLVPTGYSKSTDKIEEHFKAQGNSEVNQFFSNENDALESRRYLDPDKITTKLKAEEEDEEKKEAEESKTNEESKEERNSVTTGTTTEESKTATDTKATNPL